MNKLLLITTIVLFLGGCAAEESDRGMIKVTHQENGQEKTYELQEYSESGAIGVGIF